MENLIGYPRWVTPPKAFCVEIISYLNANGLARARQLRYTSTYAVNIIYMYSVTLYTVKMEVFDTCIDWMRQEGERLE